MQLLHQSELGAGINERDLVCIRDIFFAMFGKSWQNESRPTANEWAPTLRVCLDCDCVLLTRANSHGVIELALDHWREVCSVVSVRVAPLDVVLYCTDCRSKP